MHFSSYKNGKSLLFYYLYGTVNYANAVLLKLSLGNSNTDKISNNSLDCMSKWKETLSTIKSHITSNSEEFDISAYYRETREKIIIKNSSADTTMLVVTNSNTFAETIKITCKIHYPWFKQVSFLTFEQAQKIDDGSFDFVVYYFSEKFNDNKENTQIESSQVLPSMGKRTTIYLSTKSLQTVKSWHNFANGVSIMFGLLNNENHQDSLITNLYYLACIALKASISGLNAPLIIPKYLASEKMQTQLHLLPKVSSLQKDRIIDFNYFNAIYFDNKQERYLASNFGTRGKRINNVNSSQLFILKTLNKDEFNNVKSIHSQRIGSLYSDYVYAG
jgi:hypothetical protein